MSPIPVDFTHAGVAPGAAAWPTLIEHIGEPAFVPALLSLCHEVAGASDLSVFMLEAQAPTLVGAVSLRGHAAQRSGQRYLQGHYYRLDGNLHIARNRAQGLCLSHLPVAEVPDRGYRSDCYDSAGLGERLSVLIPYGPRWVFLNAYRPLRSTLPFDAALSGLRAHAPALAAALRRHLALTSTRPVEAPDPMAELSSREREVVEQILAGRTAKEAARELGLSATSVATYRERAFRKLGVRRQVELFQRFHRAPAA